MKCTKLQLPDGTRAIVCTSRRRKRCRNCRAPATRDCDWKMPGKRSGTCDAGICDNCTYSPAPDKDLCPAHRKAWELHPLNQRNKTNEAKN